MTDEDDCIASIVRDKFAVAAYAVKLYKSVRPGRRIRRAVSTPDRVIALYGKLSSDDHVRDLVSDILNMETVLGVTSDPERPSCLAGLECHIE